MDEKKKDQTAEKKPTTKVSAKEKALIEENEKLIAENAEIKKQVEEFKDKWIRNVAEFDNYKKRTASQWAEGYAEGESSIIKKILPVGDNLDWALSLGLDEKTAEGIKKIRAKFDETLKSLEVEEINPIGQPFDPNFAEAVMQVSAEEGDEPDTVKQVFQKGYKKKDKIIRYATVSVVK